MYRENVQAIHAVCKKSRHCVIQIDIQQQRPKLVALGLLRVARQSDEDNTVNRATRTVDEISGGLPFFGNLGKKLVVSVIV